MWKLKVAMRWLLGLFFVLAGINHFLSPDFYVSIMPSYLPWHEELVYLSGDFEFILGALVLIPRYEVPAAWGIIALLIAVFPANIHMVMNPSLYPKVSPVFLWIRLPLQGVMMVWAYWFTRTTAAAPVIEPDSKAA